MWIKGMLWRLSLVVFACAVMWFIRPRNAQATFPIPGVPERMFSAHGCDVYRFVDPMSTTDHPVVVYFTASTGDLGACSVSVVTR